MTGTSIRQGQTTNRQKYRDRKAANACVLRFYQVAHRLLVLTGGLCLVCSSERVRRVCDKPREGEGTMEKNTRWEELRKGKGGDRTTLGL